MLHDSSSRRTWRVVWMVRTGALACAMACHAQAFAQTAADEKPVAQDDADRLNDIVVTANRREENLQKVPITVTALPAEDLQNAVITSAIDLQQLVPGLTMDQKLVNPAPFIRGLGTATAQIGLESEVATYIDDVYQPTPVGSSFLLNSISRIEVLKGPQGTLFGRNSSGGVIAVHTRDPRFTGPAVDADFGIGSYETGTTHGYINLPFSDSVALNVAGYYSIQNDGWGRNLFDGSEFRKGWESSLRAKLRFQPTEDLEIIFAGWYSSFFRTNAATTMVPGAVVRIPGVTPSTYVCTNCGTYDINTNDPYGTRGRATGGSAKLTYQLPWATLINIASYQTSRTNYFQDIDMTPVNRQFFDSMQPDRTFTNEIRLASPSGSAIAWQLGLYYLDERSQFRQTQTGPAVPAGSVISSRIKTRSIAPFAQVTIPLGEKTRVTGGLRYTADRREIEGFTGPLNGAPTTVVNPKRASYGEITYKASIDHDFAPDVLGFLSYSRGFKSGVFSVAAPAASALTPENVDSYEAGLKTRFFDRRVQLNASLFYYNVTDLQLRAFLPNSVITTFTNAGDARGWGIDVDMQVAIGGGFKISGGAEYLDAKFTRNPLCPTVTVNPPSVGGTTSAVRNCAGNRLPMSSAFTPNATLAYNGDLKDGSSVDASVSLSYKSKFFFEQDNFFSQPGYALANAQIVWNAPEDRWSLAFWAKNLFDKRYLVEALAIPATPIQTPGAPRTFGVRLGFKFGAN
ncbi:TonB-dependent receptor [Sphingomonas sp. MG17]|uniref:TonB-dependent receptor n=1 Tax=Sphingomonas tagetis TaxID=2949092 RepID=A0A9X2HPC4_9SPHN|nr:TonB-dependent receptor [Sphingomonas tagetis]MCP3732111.1 TonB-dependent receptor [Sphingomonas tagetis]